MPARARTAPADTLTSGISIVARMIARAQSRDRRENENAYGAADPTRERRLSAAVSPG